MSVTPEKQILQDNEFYEKTFLDLHLEKETFENKEFENCQFTKCDFNEAKFLKCKFIDCEFNACNLSGVTLRMTSFSETIFEESKLIGINWTQARWSQLKLPSTIKFYKSNISHSSFYNLDLPETIIEQCKAHDVDFRECDLTSEIFTETDFEQSLFMHTNLFASDFTEAINYIINPLENNIKKAKFSLPDAMNLLIAFEIDINPEIA